MTHRYRFNEGVHLPTEQWKRRGKAEWANILDLAFPRTRALALAEQLIRAARENEDYVILSLCGELVPDDDDDADGAQRCAIVLGPTGVAVWKAELIAAICKRAPRLAPSDVDIERVEAGAYVIRIPADATDAELRTTAEAMAYAFDRSAAVFKVERRDGFVECETCRAKPGSPVLCDDCLRRRAEWSERRRLT